MCKVVPRDVISALRPSWPRYSFLITVAGDHDDLLRLLARQGAPSALPRRAALVGKPLFESLGVPVDARTLHWRSTFHVRVT